MPKHFSNEPRGRHFSTAPEQEEPAPEQEPAADRAPSEGEVAHKDTAARKDTAAPNDDATMALTEEQADGGADDRLPAPLGRREVATVQPDSPTYRAEPSPYLSERQAARDPEKTKRRHFVAIGITLAAAAAVGIGGGAYYVHQQLQSQVQKSTTQFVTARITRGEYVDTIDASSTLEAANTADVTTQVTGTVKSLQVEDGSTVKQGQTLFTLDNPTITAATQTAKDERDQAQSDVDAKAQQVQEAQDTLDKARQASQESSAKIYSILGTTPGATTFNVDTTGDGTPDALDTDGDGTADAFDTNGDGIVDMVDTNGDGTPDTVDSNGDGKADSSGDFPSTLTDQQKADLASAESALAAARSQIESDQTALDNANTVLSAAQDSLESLQEAYDRAVQQEKKLTVTAPIAGTVHNVSSSLAEGRSLDTVGKVCQIDDMSSLIVTVQAPERKIHRAKAGQEARLTFPTIEDLDVTTTVDSVAASKTEGTDTYAVTMTIKDPDSRLEVGTAVDASIVLQQIEDVLMVPADAIQTQGQDSYLDVLLDPVRGIDAMVKVRVVASNESDAVVEADNIQEGNAVVLSKTEG